jgi:hypothetical protein
MTDHVVGWNTQENTLVIGAAGEGTISPTSVATDEIVFPATQVPSAGANTLDDYEEGTWTPVLTIGTPGDLSVAYTTQSGTYRKVGGLLFITGNIRTSTWTHTTASGTVNVTGLPFTSTATYQHNFTTLWQGITKANYTHVYMRLAAAASSMNVGVSGSGRAADMAAAADAPTGGTVRLNFSGCYTVA